ncbi:MAG: hypothetical protein WC636_01445 [Candidatus Margulisiibacteriota bacterium]
MGFGIVDLPRVMCQGRQEMVRAFREHIQIVPSSVGKTLPTTISFDKVFRGECLPLRDCFLEKGDGGRLIEVPLSEQVVLSRIGNPPKSLIELGIDLGKRQVDFDVFWSQRDFILCDDKRIRLPFGAVSPAVYERGKIALFRICEENSMLKFDPQVLVEYARCSFPRLFLLVDILESQRGHGPGEWISESQMKAEAQMRIIQLANDFGYLAGCAYPRSRELFYLAGKGTANAAQKRRNHLFVAAADHLNLKGRQRKLFLSAAQNFKGPSWAPASNLFGIEYGRQWP